MNNAYEVVDEFEPRGRESRYLPVADGKKYKLSILLPRSITSLRRT